MGRMPCGSKCATPAGAWTRSRQLTCLSPSTRPRWRGLASGYRSAAPSSRRMAGLFRLPPTRRTAQCFGFRCLSGNQCRRWERVLPVRESVPYRANWLSITRMCRARFGPPESLIMGEVSAVVFVIDDDPSMRGSLEDLIGSVGLDVRPFASPQEFLDSERPDTPSCLVLDVRLPGMSGLTFQKELVKVGVDLPVIFITGHGDIP